MRTHCLILAIDDMPDNLFALGAVLAPDFDLQIAVRGEQGLRLAQEERPDLILLDVMMPGMDGFEVCRRLKADPDLARIPVIFITALGDFASEAAGLELGAADYLTKPINVDLARLRIRNLLERERLRREVEAYRDQLETKVQERTLALSIAVEAAQAANRAKSSFLATVSHEMRTPLNTIIGMTHLAQAKISDPKVANHLGKSLMASDQLLGLIDNLIDVADMEARRLTVDHIAFELHAVLQPIEALLQQSALKKNLQARIAVEPALRQSWFMGDPKRLGQILGNLVDNAAKFTQQGCIALRATAKETGAAATLLRFEVEDTGCGMAPAHQRKLFMPFELGDSSTTRQHGGTGIGLALCRQLVELMGGQIGVDSQLGAGSTFWFTVPLAPAPNGGTLAKLGGALAQGVGEIGNGVDLRR